MERLTQKNEIFEYALPCQNVVGDNQATEISLSETEYTCKKYIVGEAIKKIGELEDVLEKYGIETTEELDGVLKPLIDNGELENWKSANFWKMQTEILKQELAELKQKAILPKFKVGQEIWEKTPLMSWKIKRIEWHKFNGGAGDVVVEIYRLGHDGTDDYNCCIMPVDSDRFFATKEEAEQKLAEIKGKKDD